mmetsp:Transcript_35517/g.81333  ORF Transcript_35517/g.81333 Transcript_35517/m.81333 type:complete len:183 (+) Transcript_35517:93-641(+)
MFQRSSGSLALPPESYEAKGQFHLADSNGKFIATMPHADMLMEEFKSKRPKAPLKMTTGLHGPSSGLLDLHYGTMRRKQEERARANNHVDFPTYDRPWTATVGYGGFIPAKESNNIVGCTFAQGSRLAKNMWDTNKHGGVMRPSTVPGGMTRHQSLTQLERPASSAGEGHRSSSVSRLGATQ